MKFKCKAAIFDMDGTLLDSMGCWRDLNGEYLRDRGLSVPAEMRGHERDYTSHAAAELFIKTYGFQETVADILADYERRMHVCYRTRIQPKPGAAAFVAALRQDGARVCVATMTPEAIAREALRRHGLEELFEFVCCSADTPYHKGDPAFFHHVARRLGARAADCWVFEDALYAVQSARAAGCRVAGILDEASRSVWPQIEAACEFVVPDYRSLLS